MPHHPSLQSLCERLASLRGVALYDIPLVASSGEPVGNNGDMLIRLGAAQLFQACGLTFVDDPVRAELLLMGGNGGMLQHYRVVPDIFRRHWTQFLHKPLLMLPSTFYFPTQRPTAGLPERSASVELFCREPVSQAHLLNDCDLPACCRVELAHDTAFALADSPFLVPYMDRPDKHILIVERDDSERADRFGRRGVGIMGSWRRRVPSLLKKPLYPLRAYVASRQSTPFRLRCEGILQEHHSDLADLPRLVCDVSRKEYYSFEGFCDSIAEAGVVLTTRLHVGILAALLGKRTYVFEGIYHKIRAIYDHSLTGYENVSFIPGGDDTAGLPRTR